MSSRNERIYINVHIHQKEAALSDLDARLNEIHKKKRIIKKELAQLKKRKKEITRRYQ